MDRQSFLKRKKVIGSDQPKKKKMKKNVRKKKVELVVRKEIRKLVFKVTKLISSLINKTLMQKTQGENQGSDYILNPMLDINQDLPHVENYLDAINDTFNGSRIEIDVIF